MNFFAADTYAPTMREQVLCQIKALGEASMKNGMTTEWKEYEPKFMEHMDSWKQCDTLTEKMKKLWYVPTPGKILFFDPILKKMFVHQRRKSEHFFKMDLNVSHTRTYPILILCFSFAHKNL